MSSWLSDITGVHISPKGTYFSAPHSPFNNSPGAPMPNAPFINRSTQPVTPPINVPNGGNVPPLDGGGTNGSSCFGLPSWVCTAGKAVGGVVGSVIPKNNTGGIDWGKLAGLGAAGAGIYTGYEQGKAQQEYLNNLLAMVQDRNSRAQADYASRKPMRDQLNAVVQSKLTKVDKNPIFSPVDGK